MPSMPSPEGGGRIEPPPALIELMPELLSESERTELQEWVGWKLCGERRGRVFDINDERVRVQVLKMERKHL